jgi:uracil-DNA glycosylase
MDSDAQTVSLPASWSAALQDAVAQPSFAKLQAFLAEERQREQVFPPESMVYAALDLTPFEAVQVVILGQDPYHDDHQAHGLAFSVQPGIPFPPSLLNIFKELRSDLGCPMPAEGSLIPWAKQGVLLLNTSLTVRAHQANSHRGKGWEEFTDAVISAVNARPRPAVFVLWGASAQKKRALIDAERNVIIESAHPSPLSARKGFFGSKPFSQVNAALERMGQPPIEWCI